MSSRHDWAALNDRSDRMRTWENKKEVPFKKRVLVFYKNPKTGFYHYDIGERNIVNRDLPIELFFFENGNSMRLDLIENWMDVEVSSNGV